MKWIWRIFTFLWLICAVFALGGDYADIPFETRAKQAEAIARGIRIDGNGRDWAGYPACVAGNYTSNDQSRNLATTRVLADAAGLYVCLSTVGKPSRDDRAFGFRLDFKGVEGSDIDFTESSGSGCPTVKTMKAGNDQRPIQGVQYAVADCVEWFVPWNSLADALPELREKVVGPGVRPWVRIMPFSFDGRKGTIVDHGAAAACVRLPATEEALNKLPAEASKSDIAEMGAMIEGQSYVVSGAKQGPEGIPGHNHLWCYDLTVKDVEHNPSRSWASNKDNHLYYAFGRKLISPVEGKVTMTRESSADHPAWNPNNKPDPNYVLVKYEDKSIWFMHIQQNSLAAHSGQSVTPGDLLAKIGDTGQSAYPHVHIQVHHGNDQSEFYPIALQNVRVSLNAGKNDYWVRDFRDGKSWNIQEGYFFEGLTNQVQKSGQ